MSVDDSDKRPYRVSLGMYTKVIYAECASGAVLEACRTMGSVLGLVQGEEFSVFPTEFEKVICVQYENPTATGPNERLPNYGRPRIVRDFISTPETERTVFGGRVG